MNNCHRARYRRIVELITPHLTAASQRRLESTMEDAYSKAMTQEGATADSVSQAVAIISERAHAYAAVDNARRIRQWAEAILAAEADYLLAHRPRWRQAIDKILIKRFARRTSRL